MIDKMIHINNWPVQSIIELFATFGQSELKTIRFKLFQQTIPYRTWSLMEFIINSIEKPLNQWDYLENNWKVS